MCTLGFSSSHSNETENYNIECHFTAEKSKTKWHYYLLQKKQVYVDNIQKEKKTLSNTSECRTYAVILEFNIKPNRCTDFFCSSTDWFSLFKTNQLSRNFSADEEEHIKKVIKINYYKNDYWENIRLLGEFGSTFLDLRLIKKHLAESCIQQVRGTKIFVDTAT